MMRNTVKSLIGLLACVCAPAMAQVVMKPIAIGSGGVSGNYYAVGGALCRSINGSQSANGMKCSVLGTSGSIQNLNGIKAGEFDIAIAQSDAQYEAYNGVGKFKDVGPNKDLRAIASLYPESYTLVVGKNSGITKLEDLKGKRFNIATAGSGSRDAIQAIFTAQGWTNADFSQTPELTTDQQGTALCDNKIDAYLFVTGFPALNVSHTVSQCGAKLVSLGNATIEKLLKNNPALVAVTIPAGTYKGINEPIATVAAEATLVTSAKTSPDVVYTFMKNTFDGLDTLKRAHTTLSGLDAKALRLGLTAPLHDGAVRFYKEKGWM